VAKKAVVADYVDLVRGTTYKSALLDRPGPVLLGLASIAPEGGFRDGAYRTYGGACPAKLMLLPGDLYISLKDLTQNAFLLGAVSKVPREISSGRLTQDTVKLVFRNGDQDIKSYLYWILRTPEYRAYCRERAIGTTNLSLSRDDFLNFPIPPPVKVKIRMAKLLDDIERLERGIRQENLSSQRALQAIFRSWFIDYAPVIDDSRPKGGEYARLFPRSLQPSPIGRIPAGWKVGVFGDLATNIRDGIQPSAIAPRTPYIALEHMLSKCVAISTWALGDDVESNKFRFKAGDTLFGKLRPYFHKVGVAPVDGVCATDILVIRPRIQEATAFVLNLASSIEFVDYTDVRSTGTKMPRTSWQDMSAYPIAIPPNDILAAFEEIGAPICRKIIANVHKERALAKVRSRLVRELFTGGVDLETRGAAAV